jgi:hypothetical protein
MGVLFSIWQHASENFLIGKGVCGLVRGAAMKAVRLTVALIALVSAGAGAQVLPGGGLAGPLYPQPGSGSLYPTPIPPQTGSFGGHGGHHRGFGTGGFFLYQEPYVVHDVVYIHDQPAAAAEPPPPPPSPREPYVLGRTYASLPGGCLKMVEGGAAYFLCSGDWYRQVGREYRAVAAP